jgi:hypothetical protein
MLQCTMFCRVETETAGWAESWYRDGSDIGAAMTALIAVAPQRAAMMTQYSQIHGLRVALVDNPIHSSQVRNYDEDPWRGLLSASYDLVGTSLQVQTVGTTGIRRPRLFRAIPDVWSINGSPNPAERGNMQGLLNFLSASLKANSFGIRAKANGTPVPSPGAVIQHATRRIEVIMPTGHPFVIGQNVQLRGFRGATPGIGGIYRVLDAGVNEIVVTRGDLPEGQPYQGGTVQSVGYTTVIVDSFYLVDVSHRNTGRPFGQRRGRRLRR